MTPILILAAGQSSRMRGVDKLLELVDGEPQLRRLAQAALQLGQPVFVALPRPDHPRAAVVADLDLTCLTVPDAAEGMSGTLRGAVAQLPLCDRFLMVLADLVEIGTAEMATVLAAPATSPDALIWRGATSQGKPGHPILFHESLRPKFAELSGDTGGDAIVTPLRDRTVLVPLPGDRARLDLDTPEDWAAWRRVQSNPDP